MAKHEASREDLIRDAVAMVDRAEYVSAAAETVVVGFRSSGAISFYFGDQPVYQFSTERKLRRVYWEGIVKAESGRLTRWTKTYHDHAVQMIATPLESAEQATMLAEMQRRLIALRDGLGSGTWRLTREVSQPGSHASVRVKQWLEDMPETFEVADSPHAG